MPTRGQTVGKALLKIRIVRSAARALRRLVGLRYLVTACRRFRDQNDLRPGRRAADLPGFAALPARQHRRHDRRPRLTAIAAPVAALLMRAVRRRSRSDTLYHAETPEGIALALRARRPGGARLA